MVNEIAVTLPRPRNEAIRVGAEAVGVLNILAHMVTTEKEARAV